MILNVCYNDTCLDFPKQVKELCQKYPLVEVVSYNENHYKEKTKAYRVKGGYSARMTPFMLLLDDEKRFVKAFYSEDNGCTLENLNDALNSYIPYEGIQLEIEHESTNN